jgi:hypothetical protein
MPFIVTATSKSPPQSKAEVGVKRKVPIGFSVVGVSEPVHEVPIVFTSPTKSCGQLDISAPERERFVQILQEFFIKKIIYIYIFF